MLKVAVNGLTVVTGGKQEKCDWVATLSAVLCVYRGTPDSTTKMSPFFFVTGALMNMPFDSADRAAPKDMENRKDMIALRLRTTSEIIPGIREASKDDSAPLPPVDGYHIGEWVWLRDARYDVEGLAPVFAPRWTGLYQVWQVWDKGSYRLRSHPRFPGKEPPRLLMWQIWDKGSYHLRSHPRFSGKKPPRLLKNPVDRGRHKADEDKEMLLKALE
jgi:hypothetical protein